MSAEIESGTTRHTIPIYQVTEILQGAREQGLDIDAMLLRADISPALLASPLSRVSQRQYARLIRVMRYNMRDESFGLCSQPVRIGAFAYMSRNLIRAGNLGEAMREGFAFYHMMIGDFVMRLSIKNDVARVRVVHKGPPDTMGCYAERVFLFFAMGLSSWLVARRLPLLRVYYPAAEKERDAYVKMLFQAPVKYQDGELGFDLEARWLDLPVVQNLMSLRAFLRQAPASLLVKYRDQTSLTERIRRLLRRHLSTEMPTLEEVGSVFGVTPQTLRRRLRAEGQTYQLLKDSLRCDAAIELLGRADMSLVDIAAMVGFSEPSTFHRAFKKWTGLPPGEYRSRSLREVETY
ncbi:AraC family transcriptional regulator [Alcanivorax sp. JB21]|uniref:AraC family transcriptional regulator n=1 Tax=Alcanivorax limicola TaxID=2874102 RepID=UPI001CBB6BEE|nr:AraC family transcriptional regulator [Alcanivorax limicola]MBZ2187540.1 AraC family transcriptional regulator [Alcanivorax limicola]